MHAGRLVADDDMDGLLRQLGGDLLVRTLEPAALLTAVAQAGWTARATAADTLVVSGPSSPDELGLVAAHAGATVLELRSESAGLEDAFFALTSSSSPTPTATESHPVPQEVPAR